jgi:hypothetical protein
MPTNPDDQSRIDLLYAKLSNLGLSRDIHYYLDEAQGQWRLVYISAMTPEQYNRANELLELIMNR